MTENPTPDQAEKAETFGQRTPSSLNLGGGGVGPSILTGTVGPARPEGSAVNPQMQAAMEKANDLVIGIDGIGHGVFNRPKPEEITLAPECQARALALHEARRVLAAQQVFGSSAVDPEKLIRVAQFILTGEADTVDRDE